MRAALAALPLLLAAPVLAQAPEPDTTAHRLPFGAAGNVLELAVANTSDDALGGVTLTVTSAPVWLRFAETAVAVGDVAPGAEAVAPLAFDVAREAPVGDPAEVTVEVRAASGALVGTKAVRLIVDPPHELALRSPRPNPARGAVRIPFELPAAGRVVVEVFDVLGRRVATLVDAEREAGAHEARLEADRLASGTYVVRLLAEGERAEARVVRLTVRR